MTPHVSTDPAPARAGRRPTAPSLLLPGALVILPALMSAAFIWTFGVDVPFRDDWTVIPVFAHWWAGELQFAELARLYNEHRIFFPLLVMLSLAELTHYNARAPMFAGWFMQCLSVAVLWLLMARRGEPLRSALWKFAPVSFVMFNLRQYENWLWDIQIVVFMEVLFFLLAVYLLATDRRGGARFYGAALCGVVSSFSFGNGLLVWPIGLAQLAGQRYFRGAEAGAGLLRRAAIWGATGGAVYLLYFSNYRKPGHHPSLNYFVRQPATAAEYFAVYLGNSLGGDVLAAAAAGVVALALALYVAALAVGGRAPTRTPAFFSLMLMTALTGAMLVVSRAGFGVEQARESRYVTFSALGVSALYALIASLAPGARRSAVMGFGLGLLAPAMMSAVVQGVEEGRRWRARQLAGAHYVRTHSVQTDAHLSTVFVVVKDVRSMIPFLEQARLSVFRDRETFTAPRLVAPQGAYAIDTINGRPIETPSFTVKSPAGSAAGVTVGGWAVDEAAEAEAAGVFVSVDGQVDVPAAYGLDRPDVARAYGRWRYRYSGFSATIPASALGKGRHTLTLKVVKGSGREYYQSQREFAVEVE